ncbi:hypothetical protein DE4585_03893 [Mycobacteroides salmoniphilum]|uniref:Uncharacterized protein n=1 Tax=Mycobacteroides salmoniphilum TaxID=404941 RepID=A0A4R8S756_9MYCO|nr:hypothetical protein [Mycobacteroides salmoniphilum]TDZ80142.1 hypothetical protein DE4585_03893 [Mycobacteroides salmoniphilum]
MTTSITPRRLRGWLNLTDELEARDSLLRHYLQAKYPNHRPLQSDYRADVHDRLVEPLAGYESLTGTAFDHMIQLRFDSSWKMGLIDSGVRIAAEQSFLCRDAMESLKWLDAAECPDASLAQYAFVYAVFTTVARRPQVMASPYFRKLFPKHAKKTAFDANRILAWPPDKIVADLMALLDVAQRQLVPRLSPDMLTNEAAPTFTGSAIIKADGDFISDGILFEFKTTREDVLRSNAIYQLLCYLLLDFDDAHHLKGIAHYSTRYGHLQMWPAQRFISTLADRKIDVSEERGRFRHFLNNHSPHPFGDAAWWESQSAAASARDPLPANDS